MLADATSSPTDAEFVSFFAGGQSFSLAITQVREIRRWSPVTPLPNAPRELLGVMNLRGAVIPIYDLAAGFGLPPTAENHRNVIVVAMHEGQTVGLLVEAVSKSCRWSARGSRKPRPARRHHAAQHHRGHHPG